MTMSFISNERTCVTYKYGVTQNDRHTYIRSIPLIEKREICIAVNDHYVFLACQYNIFCFLDKKKQIVKFLHAIGCKTDSTSRNF